MLSYLKFHLLKNGAHGLRGSGGGKGASQPPPPAPAAPPPASATPLKNPNSSSGGDPQRDMAMQRAGTRSLRIDLGSGGTTGGAAGSAASGLNIPS